MEDLNEMYKSYEWVWTIQLLFFFYLLDKKLHRMALSLANSKVVHSEIHNNRTILINHEAKWRHLHLYMYVLNEFTSRRRMAAEQLFFPTFFYEIIAVLWLCRAASFVRCPSPQQGRQHFQPARDRIAPQTLSTLCVCAFVNVQITMGIRQ